MIDVFRLPRRPRGHARSADGPPAFGRGRGCHRRRGALGRRDSASTIGPRSSGPWRGPAAAAFAGASTASSRRPERNGGGIESFGRLGRRLVDVEDVRPAAVAAIAAPRRLIGGRSTGGDAARATRARPRAARRCRRRSGPRRSARPRAARRRTPSARPRGALERLGHLGGGAEAPAGDRARARGGTPRRARRACRARSCAPTGWARRSGARA